VALAAVMLLAFAEKLAQMLRLIRLIGGAQ